tara:strand:+ start:710 stop:1057 length:348 start_codon:yes stop_codon:yes gene_type:complete
MGTQFKENSLSKRISESRYIISKYPDRIPIIVGRHPECKWPDIDKFKYIVPKDMQLSQFIFYIRKRIKLESTQTLFVTINNSLFSGSKAIGDIYEEEPNEDGFLYLLYTNENTFG